jgi:hypothetical protein
VKIDVDHFYFYGKIDESEELEADLFQGLIQDKRSLFYNRAYGAGVPSYENAPGGFYLQVSLPYDIVLWFAKRNQVVSDGSNGYRDRRAVTSQTVISIEQKVGQLDVNVPYVPYFNRERMQALQVPIG